MGIEPTLSAWEADALPLSYTRKPSVCAISPTLGYSMTILIQLINFVNKLPSALFKLTKAAQSCRITDENQEVVILFSYAEYRKILAEIKASGKYVTDMRTAAKAEEFVLLRHDIEFSIARAYALAAVETEEGISSNYFVQITNNAYNPFSGRNACMLREMQKNGHVIGLHYHMNGESDPVRMKRQIKEQACLLAQLCGIDVTTFSIHRPSKAALAANIMPEGLINSYCAELFTYIDDMEASGSVPEVKYVSDSRHGWNYAEPWDKPCAGMFAENKKVQILAHPYSWTEEGKNSLENFRSLINESSAEYVETIDSECRHFHELRSQL